jgi:hypothetical protein
MSAPRLISSSIDSFKVIVDSRPYRRGVGLGVGVSVGVGTWVGVMAGVWVTSVTSTTSGVGLFDCSALKPTPFPFEQPTSKNITAMMQTIFFKLLSSF